MNMWKTGQVLHDGTDAGVINAMQHWSAALSSYQNAPETFKRALANLPPDPPTLPAFVKLMRDSYIAPVNQYLTIIPTAEQRAIDRRIASEAMARIKQMIRERQ